MNKYGVELHDKFGKLEVVDIYTKKQNSAKLYAWCKCDCGNYREVTLSSLVQKIKPIRSCGCLRLEQVHESKTIHGDSGGKFVGERTKLYRTWSNMKSRCYNPNVRSYVNYGAKGVIVCDEWLNDFVAFKEWALANGYQEELTIDRIDSSGNYCPENCRWITSSENSIHAHEKSCWGKNLETDEYVEFINIRNFAKEHGLSYSCIDRVLHNKNKSHKNWIFGYL